MTAVSDETLIEVQRALKHHVVGERAFMSSKDLDGHLPEISRAHIGSALSQIARESDMLELHTRRTSAPNVYRVTGGDHGGDGE